jgi:ribosomal 50S subunit-recycling heat shock protein
MCWRSAKHKPAELVKRGDFIELTVDSRKYRSEALAAIHEAMEALHRAGAPCRTKK